MVRPAPEVLIVAYGTPQLLADALAALRGTFMVHVVDNSRSEQVREVTQAHGASYVRPHTNLGFAGGVNVGLSRVVQGRDVLLLNPDACVTPEVVVQLQASLGPRVAAVAPLLRRPNGEVERTTWPMPSPLQPWRGAVGWPAGKRRPTFVSGAVLLLNGDALQLLGPFDERYFLYAEESDWQLTAQRAGWTVREVADAEAMHVGAAASPNAPVREGYFHSSAELFIRKWYGRWGWAVFRAGSLVAATRRFLLAAGPDRRAARTTLSLYFHGPVSKMPPRPAP